MELFKKLNKNGLTVIMVTHDQQAASYADINYEFSQLLKRKQVIHNEKD